MSICVRIIRGSGNRRRRIKKEKKHTTIWVGGIRLLIKGSASSFHRLVSLKIRFEVFRCGVVNLINKSEF